MSERCSFDGINRLNRATQYFGPLSLLAAYLASPFRQRYLCGVVLIATLVLSTSALGGQRLVLVNESGDASSAMGQSLIEMAEMIERQSRGRLDPRVFHRGELGGQQESFDHLMKGSIDIMLSWPGTSYDSRLGAIYMPYLVLGWDDALTAYSDGGWLKALLDPVFRDNGLLFFGPYPEGFGGVATRGRYATNKEDARGIKVRSAPIFPLPQSVQALGFEAVPIDWNEVYTSIQTGVVDGDSSNVIYWDYEYFGELLDYFVHSKHNFSSFALMMNLSSFDALSEADQTVVLTAAKRIINKQFANARAEDQKWISAAQKDGMQYIEPSAAEYSAWVKSVRAEVWPQAESAIGRDMMDQIRANASSPKGEGK